MENYSQKELLAASQFLSSTRSIQAIRAYPKSNVYFQSLFRKRDIQADAYVRADLAS